MASPGWAEIVAKANSRISANMLAMVATRDEKEALDWHRRGWAAKDALEEFIQVLEDEKESNEHRTR